MPSNYLWKSNPHPITNLVFHALNEQIKTKYPGITILSDLRFDKHINDEYSKSRKLLGGRPRYWLTQVYAERYLNMHVV